MSKTKKFLFVAGGILSIGAGVAGIYIEFLPTVPFFLLAVFLLIMGIDFLRNGIKKTGFFKRYIRPFRLKKGVTARVKAIIVAILLVTLFAAAYFSHSLVLWIILGIHMIVLPAVVIFKHKTISEEEAQRIYDEAEAAEAS
ncbi:MAG: YbaN family protein, partial [Eggerthellaceae bacterium]|nr:YbaN family protein [Eggerthellaceae bacterium]